jgi:hypothetical protein
MRNDIPNDNASNFGARVRETLMTYLGKQGDPLDRGVTLRDLVDSGIATVANFKFGGGSAPLVAGTAITDSYVSDLTPPPTPTNFKATASISSIILECDDPVYAQGHGHLRSHVYGATRTGNAAQPVFSDAVEITAFAGKITSYSTNPSTEWHLWIKWESVDGVLSVSPAGGTNGVVVTTGQDVSKLLTALTGKLRAEQLYTDLGSRIDLIDAAASVPGSVNARVSTLQAQINDLQNTPAYSASVTYLTNELVTYNGGIYQAKQTTLNHVPTNDTYWTKVGDYTSLGQAVAAHTTQIAKVVSDLSAEATLRTTLDAQVNDADTGLPATRANITNNYYTKTDTDSAITTATSSLVSTTALTTKLKDYETKAALVNDYYTKTDADSAITTATQYLVSTTGLTTALSTYATTATLTNSYYTKTATDSAITTATSTLVSTSGLATALGDYPTTATLTTNYYTKTGADTAISTATTALSSSFKKATLSLPLDAWVLNGQSIVTIANGKSGTKALRLSGVAGAYPNQGAYLPINTGKTYRVRFWARPSSDAAGLLYFSLRQFTDDAGSAGPTNGGRSPYKPSGQSRADHIAAYGDTWGEYNFTWSTSDWQTGAKYFLPEFLDNYSGKAGYWDIQGLTIQDVTDVEATNATLTNDYYTKAAADTAISNATTTLTARVGKSGNLVDNSEFVTDLSGWVHNGVYDFGRNLSTDWTLTGTGTAYIHQPDQTSTGLGEVYTSKIPVIAGNKYEWSIYTGAHRCTVDAFIYWYNNSGTNLGYSTLNSNAATQSGGPTLVGYKRLVSIGAAPTGATYAVGVVRKNPTYSGQGDSWAFFTYAFFGQAGAQQTEATAYSPGSLNAATSALQVTASTNASTVSGLSGKYTVKIDLNGYVSGYGLASTANTAAASSTFSVRADSFYIASPSGPGITPTMPFIVRTVKETIGGVEVPVGVYMNDAYIQNGTITNAKIANATIEDAKIVSLGVAKLAAGSLNVGQYIKSSNFVTGSAGWYIGADGTAEFGAASIRGQLTASQIDSRGLTIKAADGTVLLTAGSSLATSAYSGNVTGSINGTAAATVVTNASTAASDAATAKTTAATAASDAAAAKTTAATAATDAATAATDAATAATDAATAATNATTAATNATTAATNAATSATNAAAAATDAAAAKTTADSAATTANTANSTANAASLAAAAAALAAKAAQDAADLKLARSGAQILTGPVTLNAASAITVGTPALNGVAGKNGFYIGSTGIVGTKDGAATFTLDNDGNALFKGNLTGATGTFSGAVSVGDSPAVSGETMTGKGARLNADGTFVLGTTDTNISFNGTKMSLNGNVVGNKNLLPGASVPDLVMVYTGSTVTQLESGLWTRIPFDATLLKNQVSSSSSGNYFTLGPGTYYYELTVGSIFCSGSDGNEGTFTALAFHKPSPLYTYVNDPSGATQLVGYDGNGDPIYAPVQIMTSSPTIISNAGASQAGDWQFLTVFGANRFTLTETYNRIMVVGYFTGSPAMVIRPLNGYTSRTLKIWRDS